MSTFQLSASSKDSYLFRTEEELEEEVYGKTGFFKHIRVARNEWPRVLYLSLLFGVITMVHTIMGNLREMVLMGRQDPMSMFFIKSIFLPPCSLLFIWAIQLGLSLFTPSKMFDITLILFSGCYILFGLVVWPLKGYIQKDFYWSRDIFGDGKMESLRIHFLYPVFLVFNEWTSSFLFLCSEMWGALVVSYFFNIFANEVSTRRQSQRYISVYNISNAISIFLSAVLTLVFNKWRDGVAFETKELGFRILILVLGSTVIGILALKKYMEREILPAPVFLIREVEKTSTERRKLKLDEARQTLSRSKLLIAISLNVLLYGVTSTLVEATFKSGIAAGARYTNNSKETFANFYNGLEQIIIAISLLVVINTPYSALVKKGGWKYLASLPIVIAMFSLFSVFLIAFYNVGADSGGNVLFGSLFKNRMPTFILENTLGLVTNASMKIGKYLGADVSKEAISMQIDPLYRAKYKAVYDGLCGKLGKSLGSIICTVMTGLWDITDIRRVSSVSGILIVIIIAMWYFILKYLSRQFQAAVEANTYIELDEF
ncbi:similarity to ATP/ADP CARRIER PROTEIN [Encephalitozoon cuniculi GB-M1]|uniref:ADP,ATP carrier protein 3 n=2 Tax=Encephalitozoon cuniculi TaxID=6035 RepID=NTT3_ENCCU|nr:ATP/ADP translocase [Encephalitozoon cuniculi GB-M1]Q8SUG0.1 RecName: Full=ADP,ATP carrier protein 3; AltName: Full=ADP/ATP translocase 3; AltName: Full=Nucleotide transporter 3 [Encephalitozoon cuniculi GB-M1]ABW20409.1 NTT3 [Encephalitozoon cuniculi]KMV65203.1 ATP/ADP translocase [Encephalitozoon cuniculi EcunIII-L]AGE96267.1 ATP/ADP carrier protein [Encephalitozoon cuniculi]UYI26511.1 ADP, ATP carrier protein [Encephalitozoon cuniculi]CAD25771.1 similarity to ATP/ADP CARRIER PROTEIN [En